MLYHKSQMLNISYWYEDPTLLSFLFFVKFQLFTVTLLCLCLHQSVIKFLEFVC